jgi:hypothetical protein
VGPSAARRSQRPASAGEPHDLQARRVTPLPNWTACSTTSVVGRPQALDPWMSYNPLRGQREQLQTQVWVAYDDKAIYFAFKCLDPSPTRFAPPSAGATTCGTTTGWA